MTATTPIYGLHYLVPGEPARNTRAALEANVYAIEAALQSHALAPPAAADLAAVAGRTSVLENGGAWQGVTFASGWTSYTGEGYATFSYRKEGPRVYLRGWVVTSAATAANALIISAALPVAFRPASTVAVYGHIDGANPVRLTMSTAGEFRAVGAFASGTYVYVGGQSYALG